jgi:glycosyltransferase involved in cell wall biosynthesis
MNIWILQTGEPLPTDQIDRRPMRATNLSNKLVSAGHNVTLWSSSFNHQEKIQRSCKYKVHSVGDNLEIRLIPSRGYKSHIGIERLIDHAQMAWNLRQLLKHEEAIPDVAFIGYPPIEIAAVMSKWLKKRNVPILLDVKDLWPSIFIDAFPAMLRPFARVLFHPYFYLAKRTMRDVDGISTMSHSFLSWCLSFINRPKSENDKIVRLTVSNSEIDTSELNSVKLWWYELGVKDDSPKLFFTGTFSTAFDFNPIYIAAKEMDDCQFILCGHGPCLDETRELMKDLPNVVFPGWIDRSQMEGLANMSIASLAPYKNVKNFTLNIPNKIVDSLMLGLPILSPLKGEVAALIKSNKVGYTYNDNISLSDCIQSLLNNDKLQKKMSENAKKLYDEEFEFDKVYDSLVDHLEGMVIKK